MDEFKLTGNTLQSVNKEVDAEEERIYAELYQELVEIDRRVSRTRQGQLAHERGRGARANTSRAGRGRGKGRRRGSGRPTTTYEHEDDCMESSDEEEDAMEPEYDDEGNLLSEGEFPSGSETQASASPMLDDDSDDDSFTLSP